MEVTFDIAVGEIDSDWGQAIPIPLDIDEIIGHNNDWFLFEIIRVVNYVGENGSISIGKVNIGNQSSIPSTAEHFADNSYWEIWLNDGVRRVSTNYSQFYSYSSSGQHVLDVSSKVAGTITILMKVTSDWN